jgi:hypothetical protein
MGLPPRCDRPAGQTVNGAHFSAREPFRRSQKLRYSSMAGSASPDYDLYFVLDKCRTAAY